MRRARTSAGRLQPVRHWPVRRHRPSTRATRGSRSVARYAGTLSGSRRGSAGVVSGTSTGPGTGTTRGVTSISGFTGSGVPISVNAASPFTQRNASARYIGRKRARIYSGATGRGEPRRARRAGRGGPPPRSDGSSRCARAAPRGSSRYRPQSSAQSTSRLRERTRTARSCSGRTPSRLRRVMRSCRSAGRCRIGD